ncbi:MAG: MFS transporter [Clostridia bacterium]
MSEAVLEQDLGEIEVTRRKTFNRNKWLFSIGGIGRDMAYTLIASFLLAYIQFGIPLTLAQFTTISLAIGVGGRVWDAINDPMMGAIIEGTHMKWGKFKPWILIGAVSCGLVIILMFNVQSLTGWSFVAFMIFAYLLWESTFTMNDIGYWAMLPSLSSVNKERNNVTTLTVLFAGLGAIIAQGLIPTLATGNVLKAYGVLSIVVAVAFIGFQIMTAFGVKEQPRPEGLKQEKVSLKKMWQVIKKNDQILWMTLSMLFYNIGSALLVALALNLLYLEVGYAGANYFIIVAVYGVTSVVINIIYPLLANRIGRKKIQFLSIMVAIIGYIAIGCMGWGGSFNIIALGAICVLISAGQSLFYMSSIINMTNCVEYNDYISGERNEAVVSTLRPFMAKFASALQFGITTLALIISGIFILSQSISMVETQKNMFGKMDLINQTKYIEITQDYLDDLKALEEGSTEYNNMVITINERILADKLMSTTQLDANYINVVGDAIIIRHTYNVKGEELKGDNNLVALGRLKDLTDEQLEERPTGDNYFVYELSVGDYMKDNVLIMEGTADIHFKDKGSLTTRIVLRLFVSIVPVLFLLIAWIIQSKKFIIDEPYYDKMLVEINRRQAELTSSEQEVANQEVVEEQPNPKE